MVNSLDKYKEKTVNISLKHMEIINNIGLDNPKKKSDKLTLFTLIYYSQIFANSNGVFEASFVSLGKRINESSKSAERAVNNLIQLGYLEAVERNLRIAGKHNCDKAKNKYRLLIDADDSDILYSFGFSQNIYTHFINCYTICYKQLKFKNVPRWLRDSINKHLKENEMLLIKVWLKSAQPKIVTYKK